MLWVTIEVDAPLGAAQGVKEQLAMLLEAWGNTRVISVEERGPEQMQMGGDRW